MNRTLYFVMDYYDKRVVERIMGKYGLDPLAATRSFLTSETHALLEDADNGLMFYPEYAVFDMWEAERATGDPRNSEYVWDERCDG